MYVVRVSICKWQSMHGSQNSFVDMAVRKVYIKEFDCAAEEDRKYSLHEFAYMNTAIQLDGD